MQNAHGLFAASIVAIATLVAATSASAATPSSGDELFARGQFAQAAVAYAAAAVREPHDTGALLGRARIELYQNELDAATSDATAVLTLQPGNVAASGILKTVAQRRAVLEGSAALAVPASGVVLPFVESEPLPAVALTVNGKAGTFLLDTGAPDLTFDPDYARECNLTIEGGHRGTFLGGRTAPVRETFAPAVGVGALTLRNVHASVMPLRAMSLFSSRRVDGVVGTIFLSRFLSTLDYPHHRLVLRARDAEMPSTVTVAVPMWLVGDHFIFAMGSVNSLEQQLFNVDSGGAGVGFMPVAETVSQAHVRTFPNKAFEGMGGGGSVTIVPIVADRVCLGAVCQNDVGGGYTPGGSPLSIFPFAAAGTVSHVFLEKYAVTFDFLRMRIVLSS